MIETIYMFKGTEVYQRLRQTSKMKSFVTLPINYWCKLYLKDSIWKMLVSASAPNWW